MISSIGLPNVLYFIGQVEEVAHGTGISGRVRVRAMGVHPPLHWTPAPDGFAGDDLSNVPTEALPWASVLSNGGAAKMPGVGEWVIGMFMDGRDAQHPVIVGVLPGFNTTLPSGSGTAYDSMDTPQLQENIDNFNESSPSSPEAWIGTGNKAEQSSMNNLRDITTKTGDGRSIEELPPEYGGDPSKLSVVQAIAQGSNIQVGGSGDSEHISIVHTTGTHIVIDSRGNVKVGTGETIQNMAANIQQYADGSYDIIAGENLTIKVAEGKATIDVAGDIDIKSGGNISLEAARKIKMNAGESIMVRGAQIDLESNINNINILSAKKFKVNSGDGTSLSAANLEVNSKGIIQLLGGGRVNMSGESMHLQGSTVYIDDIVRMAEGGASKVTSEAEDAVSISTDDLPAPRQVSFTSPGKTTAGVSGAINASQIDDVE